MMQYRAVYIDNFHYFKTDNIMKVLRKGENS